MGIATPNHTVGHRPPEKAGLAGQRRSRYTRQKLRREMDNPKSRHELEQEVLILRDSVREEKLKKADELIAHRLVYSTIIFVIIFIILCGALEDSSNWVQWPCLITFFGAALFVLGRIAIHYNREKEEADIQ
jgi:hypothetical protein